MNSLLKILFIFGMLLFLQLAQSANAQTPYTGLQSLAMGGTGRAAVDVSSVAFLNPAAMAHVTGYNIGTDYRRMAEGQGQTQHNIVIHLAENQPDTMFPLSVTYMKTNDMLADGSQTQLKEFHFTTAQLVGNQFSVGLDFSRYSYQTATLVPQSHWDYKLGGMFVPRKDLGFGLVLSNLKTTNFTFLNRNIEFGVNYIFQTVFRFAADYVYGIQNNPQHSGIFMLGAEHLFSDQFPIRFGYRYDGFVNKNYGTAGFGWIGPKIGLNYAFEKNFSQGHDYGHSIDLKIYF